MSNKFTLGRAQELTERLNDILREKYIALFNETPDEVTKQLKSEVYRDFSEIDLDESISKVFKTMMAEPNDTTDYVYLLSGQSCTQEKFAELLVETYNATMPASVQLTYGSADDFQIVLTVDIEVSVNGDDDESEILEKAVDAIPSHKRRAIDVYFDVSNPDDVEVL